MQQDRRGVGGRMDLVVEIVLAPPGHLLRLDSLAKLPISSFSFAGARGRRFGLTFILLVHLCRPLTVAAEQY